MLPIQRYRLQTDLQRRVDELSSTLDTALRAHLEEELQRAISRSREIVAPFARLVEREGAAHAERTGLLESSAAPVEELQRELLAMGAAGPPGGEGR